MARASSGQRALIERTKEAAKTRNTSRLGALVALIRRRVTEVVEGFYDIGEALREIQDRKLYGAAGHRSMEAFLKAEGLMSYRQATKLIAVVRRVPREQALLLGQEKAYALVAYADATPESDSPAELVAKNARVGGKSLAAASVRDIEGATRAARTKARATRPATEAERAKARAEAALVKALRAALRKAGLGRATIEVGRERVRIELTRAQAQRLARAG